MISISVFLFFSELFFVRNVLGFLLKFYFCELMLLNYTLESVPTH